MGCSRVIPLALASLPGNNLKIVRAIEGVTKSRRNQSRGGAVDVYPRRFYCEIDLFVPASNHFEHQIEVAPDGVYSAASKIVIGQIVTANVAEDRHAGIEVNGPAITNDLAERQIRFVTDTAITEPFLFVASGSDQCQSRRECRNPFAFHQGLQSVIQSNIGQTVRVVRECIRNGVGKLVGLTKDRPFLSEAGRNLVRVSGEKARQIKDVLHDAGLLIVGFFNEKRVVLNAFSQRLLGHGRHRTNYCHQKKMERMRRHHMGHSKYKHPDGSSEDEASGSGRAITTVCRGE